MIYSIVVLAERTRAHLYLMHPHVFVCAHIVGMDKTKINILFLFSCIFVVVFIRRMYTHIHKHNMYYNNNDSHKQTNIFLAVAGVGLGKQRSIN